MSTDPSRRYHTGHGFSSAAWSWRKHMTTLEILQRTAGLVEDLGRAGLLISVSVDPRAADRRSHTLAGSRSRQPPTIGPRSKRPSAASRRGSAATSTSGDGRRLTDPTVNGITSALTVFTTSAYCRFTAPHLVTWTYLAVRGMSVWSPKLGSRSHVGDRPVAATGRDAAGRRTHRTTIPNSTRHRRPLSRSIWWSCGGARATRRLAGGPGRVGDTI